MGECDATFIFLGCRGVVAAADTIGKQISTPSVALSGDVVVSHEEAGNGQPAPGGQGTGNQGIDIFICF